jgi:hypothetical protein
MTITNDLLGLWTGRSMSNPRSQAYEMLVFKDDGTGFLDLYQGEDRFSELFRWTVEPPARLRLEGYQLTWMNPGTWTCEERKSTLNTVVRFRIREKDFKTLGRMRVLRFSSRPWAGMSEYFLHYRRDLPFYATFHAPCFVLEEERAEPVFRGKALSDYLARQLKARHVRVGPRSEVFFGACWYRAVKIHGKVLGLAVNEDKETGKWWLRIDRPRGGETVGLEALYPVLQEILQGVEGLRDLEWQTEDEWYGRASSPNPT